MKLAFWRKDPRANHSFDEKDREVALERRRLNMEIENLKRHQEMERLRLEHQLRMAEMQEQLEDLFPDDEDEPSSSPEDAIAMKLFERFLSPQATTPPTTIQSGERSYSDDELRAIMQKVSPQHIALAKTCTHEQISEFIKAKVLPDADADTLRRSVVLLTTV